MKTNKNTKILMVLSIVLLIAFAGCTSTTKTEQTTPGGNVSTIEGSGPDWCKAGSSLTQGQTQQGQYSYVIKGMTTYKNQEVCEAEATVTQAGQQSYSMTYYFSKDSKFSHLIMKDASGNVVKDMDTTQSK
jgi:hypothetical protein